jgi:hypothetical protein
VAPETPCPERSTPPKEVVSRTQPHFQDLRVPDAIALSLQQSGNATQFAHEVDLASFPTQPFSDTSAEMDSDPSKSHAEVDDSSAAQASSLTPDVLPRRSTANSPIPIDHTKYEAYLSRELPGVVRRELEAVMESTVGPIEDKLRSQFEQIVRDCQENLFNMYTQTMSDQFPEPSRISSRPYPNISPNKDDHSSNTDEGYYSFRSPHASQIMAGFPRPEPVLLPTLQQDSNELVESDLLSKRAHATPNITPSATSDSAACELCGNIYKGEYGRGNLARHRRQKHGLGEQHFSCEESDCGKTFKRPDARLKHYRREHPHLTSDLVYTRKLGETVASSS